MSQRRPPIVKAISLGEAITSLDPTLVLSTEELPSFYVDRVEVRKELYRMKTLLSRSYPCKILLTGHRGVGKSSAMTCLTQDLNNGDHFVIRFSAFDRLDLVDIDYVDIVFLIALQIIEECREQRVNISKLSGQLERWSNEIETVVEDTQANKLEVEAKIEVTPPNLGWLTWPVKALLAVGSKISKEQVTRQKIRQHVLPRFSELLQIIDSLQQEVFQETRKRVVCIIDGTDKVSVEAAENLFYRNGQNLGSMQCSVVYTFPIALRHSPNFGQIKPYFSEVVTLANFKVYERNNLASIQDFSYQTPGKQLLREVITRRVDHQLFTDNALQKLVHYSGGIVRNTLMLAKSACVSALFSGKTQVMEEHVDEAIDREVTDFSLSDEQLNLLRYVRDNCKINPDPAAGYLGLLHNMSVIEYTNGRTWHGINPIIQGLL
jgi:AAA+ ATPase superfamily predicted ATPase